MAKKYKFGLLTFTVRQLDESRITWCKNCGEKLSYDGASGECLPSWNAFVGSMCRVSLTQPVQRCEPLRKEHLHEFDK